MTLIAEIVDAASGESVSVATLLRKVKVLASRTDVPALAEWVDHELTGYPSGTDLPAYRGPFHVGALGNFAGPFQSTLSSAPIPEAAILQHFDAPHLFRTELRYGVGALADLAGSSKGVRGPWPADAIGYVNGLIEAGELELYPMMGIVEAWNPLPRNLLTSALEAVRTRVLDLALEFERSAPTAGEVAMADTDKAQAQVIVTNVFGSVGNLAVSSSDFTQTSLPGVGDIEGLLAFARGLGVTDAELRTLEEAVGHPDDDEPSRRERLQGWLGRYLISPATRLTEGAGADLLARAIAGFLGHPFAG